MKRKKSRIKQNKHTSDRLKSYYNQPLQFVFYPIQTNYGIARTQRPTLYEMTMS